MTDRRAEAQRERKLRVVGSVAIAAVALAALLGFGAWRTVAAHEAEGDLDEPAAAAAAAPAGATREVVDSLGRTVAVPEEPAHVAIMDPFSGEFAIMIGAGAQVCGIPNGVRSDTILQQIYPQMDEATFATSGSTVNIETLVDAGCDVALVKPTMSSEELAKLTRMGIPYVAVGYATVEEQLEAMQLVGEVLGGAAQSAADGLIGDYRSIIQQVAERVAGIAPEDRLNVYHSINEALRSDGEGSIGRDWIEQAGCVSAAEGTPAGEGGVGDVMVSLETVYLLEPQLIICNAATAADEFLTEPKWQALSAVQQGKVLAMPVGASRWGQRGDVETALAMLWLASTAYPERFAGVSLQETVQRVYAERLGVEVDDALYEMIISGRDIRETGTGSGGGQ